MASPIPEGFNSVSAYLIVKDVRAAIDFYGKAFGATGGACMTVPGTDDVMHAELRIGNSTIMLSAENPQWGSKSAETLGGSPVSIHLYVEDCDAVWARALEAGCEQTAEMMDAFWGDRYGKCRDPFGIEWGIATHKQDLTPEQIDQRAAEWFANFAGGAG